MAENSSKLMTESKPQIQETQRTTSKINKNLYVRNAIWKLQKQRQRENLQRSWRRGIPYLKWNKDKNYFGFLIRNYASKERVE